MIAVTSEVIRAKGVDAYGIGPARTREEMNSRFGAHSDDERIAEDSLQDMTRFLWEVVLQTLFASILLVAWHRSPSRAWAAVMYTLWALTVLICGVLFSGILWFFEKAGPVAWLYCWMAVTVLWSTG